MWKNEDINNIQQRKEKINQSIGNIKNLKNTHEKYKDTMLSLYR